jgi:hypothetical protein
MWKPGLVPTGTVIVHPPVVTGEGGADLVCEFSGGQKRIRSEA